MIARCTECKRAWNISIYQKIPPGGYVCPHCEARKHKGRGEQLSLSDTGTKGRRKRDAKRERNARRYM